MNSTDFFKTLKSQNLSHLEKDIGVSRQALHNALKTHNMKLDNLSIVAKALNLKVEFIPITNEENVMSSLAKWGAPLAHSKNGNLSVEDCVRETLNLARHDGIYESLLPYVLYLNVKNINPLKLAATAYMENQVNVLGYFVELAHLFRPNAKFQFLLRLLEPAKSDDKEFLVLSTKSHFPEMFEKNKLALKWNLKVRGNEHDHLLRWEKWEKSLKHN